MKKLSLALLLSAALAAPALAQNAPVATPTGGNNPQQFGQKSDERFADRQKAEQEYFQKRQAIEEKYHAQFKALAEQEHAEFEQLRAEVKKNHPGMAERMGNEEGGPEGGGGQGQWHPGGNGGAAPASAPAAPK